MTDQSETAPLILDARQYIGCGRIAASQPCIGVCQDRKVRFVYAFEHARVLDRLAAVERLARRLMTTMPREGGGEWSYRTMQEEARRALAALSQADKKATAGT
jgi:hypothetical protein